MSDIQKTQTKKRKVGRPPAKWVYELANLDLPDDQFLDYHDLAEMFGITIRTVHGFCSKAKVEGDYYKTADRTIRKKFKVSQLKESSMIYVKRFCH